MRLIILFCCLLCSLPTKASNGTMPLEQKLAMEYVEALTEQDYKTLRRFYTRDSLFFDNTADRKYLGERQIVSFFERAHEGVLEYRFNIEHMFNSGSLVVIIGNYRFRGPGEQFGKPDKIIEVAVPGVTTLKFDMKTQRLIEHMDLMDYQTLTDQLESQ